MLRENEGIFPVANIAQRDAGSSVPHFYLFYLREELGATSSLLCYAAIKVSSTESTDSQ